MRPIAAALAALFLLGGGSGAATAAPWTAADLRDACADGDLYYIYGACAGYVLAVHNRDATEGAARATHCMPEETTIFDINGAVEAVLPGLPAVEGESGAELALRVLAAAFPCD